VHLPADRPQPPLVTHDRGRPQCLCIPAKKHQALLSRSPRSLPRSRFRGIVETGSSRPVERHQWGGQAQWGTAGPAMSPSCLAGLLQESLPMCSDSFKLLIPLCLPASAPPSSLPCYFFLLATFLCSQVKGLPYGKKKLSRKLGDLIKASPDSMNNHQTLNWTKGKAIQMETEGYTDLS